MNKYLSPAKINWFLHVTGRREDGYHLLETVFQRIDWCDELYITPRDDGLIQLRGNLSNVSMAQNLAYRAAFNLRQYLNNSTLGADILLHKNIPTGAGLGGGSSNAATVLLALNELWRAHLSNSTLQQIGLNLGADVPFFVSGLNAAHAIGIGEKLQAIALPKRELLLVKANEHMSTAAVFNHPLLQRNHASLNLNSNQLAQLLLRPHSMLSNDLEKATFDLSKPVQLVYDSLCRAVPQAIVRMSGSGATIFAVPTNEQQKQALLEWQDLNAKNNWQVRWIFTF